MLKFATRSSVVLWAMLLLPASAAAQAAITGVVKDTSGAVLPGVTVEVASPVLIEKVRSVVSDATGQYRIVNLRPGIYTVTFTLPGFSTVKREGIELTGTFVAAVNGDLKVGALEKTITVTGETRVVDVSEREGAADGEQGNPCRHPQLADGYRDPSPDSWDERWRGCRRRLGCVGRSRRGHPRRSPVGFADAE